MADQVKKPSSGGSLSDAERAERIARLIEAGKPRPLMTPEERVKFITAIRERSVPPFEDTTPLIRRDRDER